LAGELRRRYQRFKADVRLADGRVVTAHCPNTGRMTVCCQPGRPVFLSRHDHPRRQLAYTWELIAMPASLVGVNTLVPNRLVAAAARAQSIAELAGYTRVQTEVRIGAHSRIDLGLTRAENDRCLVEVKNCTLVEEGTARFPDAVTARGRKHLEELARQVSPRTRCVILFLVQRMDAALFRPAASIDPDYAAGLRAAAAAGVEVLAYDVHMDLQGIRLRGRLPVEL
jgi:sugar fermentation stimulation protein A